MAVHYLRIAEGAGPRGGASSGRGAPAGSRGTYPTRGTRAWLSLVAVRCPPAAGAGRARAKMPARAAGRSVASRDTRPRYVRGYQRAAQEVLRACILSKVPVPWYLAAQRGRAAARKGARPSHALPSDAAACPREPSPPRSRLAAWAALRPLTMT